MNKNRYFDSLNNAFLALFARRLSDLINVQGTALLAAQNLVTPSTSVSTVLFLAEGGAATITEISSALDFTHQMATQRINILKALGLVERIVQKQDRRSRKIILTTSGQKEAEILLAVCRDTDRALKALNLEIGCDLSAAIKQAEQCLRKKPLLARIKNEKA